jgi:hypothetical protein
MASWGLSHSQTVTGPMVFCNLSYHGILYILIPRNLFLLPTLYLLFTLSYPSHLLNIHWNIIFFWEFFSFISSLSLYCIYSFICAVIWLVSVSPTRILSSTGAKMILSFVHLYPQYLVQYLVHCKYILKYSIIEIAKWDGRKIFKFGQEKFLGYLDKWENKNLYEDAKHIP